MNARLQLLVLAQAMDDIISEELGEGLSEEDLATAENYVADYPALLTRVWEGRDLERWRREISKAREELSEALSQSRVG